MAANGHGDVAAFENRQALTVAKFIDKSSKSILLLCEVDCCFDNFCKIDCSLKIPLAM